MKRSHLLCGALIILVLAAPVFALSGKVWSEVKDNVAYVHHDDGYFNCCPEMVFDNEIHKDTTLIDIYEQDTLPQCLCMCYYDFTHTFKGLEPGTYVARVWESTSPGQDFSLAGETFFTITARITASSVSTAMGECSMDPEGVEESSDDRGLELENVSSSPTQPSVGIRYHLPHQGEVKLVIYDATGSRVRTLQAGSQDVGDHVVVWDTRNDSGQRVSRGIYFVRLQSRGEARTLRAVVLR